MNTKNHFIVIMAGGSGTRLWPLSRKSKPKQFHTFLSEKTLLEETYARANKVVPKEQIFISTGAQHIENIRNIFPEISEKRLIIEPFSRNTAPAITLVSATIRAQFPDAIIATIASDHAIANEDEFTRAINVAFDTVARNPDKLITIGINPIKPDTGLGYIKLGREFKKTNEERIFYAEAFKEKPDRATAESYLMSFEYLWNAGYFIFSAETFSEWLKKFSPDLSKIECAIYDKCLHNSLNASTLETIYATAPEEAVEPVIIEKLAETERLVIPAPMRWSDIGSWDTLYEFLKEGKNIDNVEQGIHIHIGSRDNLVHGSGRIVATLGVKNLVIIDTDDALLVAHRDRASEMKKLIEELKKCNLNHLL